MVNEKKLSSVLIGNNKKFNSSKYSSVIFNKTNNNSNKLSSRLIGNLRDKDRDGYVKGFSVWVDDCNDKNKYKDGWLSNTVKKVSDTVKNIVSPTKPSTPSPAPAKSTTPAPSQSNPFKAPSTPFTSKPSTTPIPSTPSGGGSSSSSTNKLQQIITPPSNPINDAVNRNTGSGGGSSSGSSGGSSGTSYSQPSTNLPMSTPQTPTPSADTLKGTPQQIEQQIQTYQQQVKQQELNKILTPPENPITKAVNTYKPAEPQVQVNPNTGRPYGVVEPAKFKVPLSEQLSIKSKQARENDNYFLGQVYSIGAFGSGYAQETFNMVYNPLRYPKETAVGIYNTIINPGKSIQSYGSQLSSGLRTNPEGTIGSVAAQFTAGELTGKFIKKTSNVYKKIGAEEVESSRVFSKDVLSGKDQFPMSSGVDNSISRFKAAREGEDLIGQTSTTFSPKRTDVSKAGSRASQGLEDPGIYITPKGEGSPYFLDVKKNVDTKYTVNPLKIYQEIKKKPNVIEIRYKDIQRIPEDVKAKPGFEGVRDFFKEKVDAGETNAYITKRSELGQGAINRQQFKDPITGRLLKESGTSEIEAVIPENSIIQNVGEGNLFQRFKGYNKYTMYEGEVIPIREYKVIGKQNEAGVIVGKNINKYEKVKKYSDSSYSYYNSKVKYKSAYPNLFSKGSGLYSSSKSISNSNYNTPKSYSISSNYVSKNSRDYSNKRYNLSSSGYIGSSYSNISGLTSSSTGSSYNNRTNSISSSSGSGSSGGGSSGGGSSGGSSRLIITRPTDDETKTIRFKPKDSDKYNNKGYIPEAYIDATKQRKAFWLKLSDKPMTKEAALDTAARFVDRTISARGKVVEVKTKEPIQSNSDSYFKANEQKFRFYKQRQGVKTKLPNSFIERRKYRADNPREVKTLVAASLKSRRTPFGF